VKRKTILVLILLSAVLFGGAVVGEQSAQDFFNKATSAYIMGDIPATLANLMDALKIDPLHSGARELLKTVVVDSSNWLEAGKKYYQDGDVDRAEAEFKKVLLARPGHPEAQDYLEKIQKEKAGTPSNWFALAQDSYDKGDLVAAQRGINRVLEVYPTHQGAKEYSVKIKQATEALAAAARQSFQSGALASAEAGFRTVLAINPENKEAAGYLTKIRNKKIFNDTFKENLFIGLIFVCLLSLCGLLLYNAGRWFKLWGAKRALCPECGNRVSADVEFCAKCGARLRVWEATDDRDKWFAKFSWTKNPFTLDVLPLTYTGHHKEIDLVMERLNTQSGHILVIGGLGSGKTIFLRWLESNLKGPFKPIYVVRPPDNPNDLINLIISTLSGKTEKTRSYSLFDFQAFCNQYKKVIIILLDEAHEFNDEFEKFIRTIGDLKNVFLIMAGLPQERERLKKSLPALFDRIVETIFLGALTLEECKELIGKRIIYAGGTGFGPFSMSALEKVHELSFGIPRGILKICDWVVTQAIRNQKNLIDMSDVAEFEAAVFVKPSAQLEGRR
jgi:type II secretory pathway predicted ATPase ExeA